MPCLLAAGTAFAQTPDTTRETAPDNRNLARLERIASERERAQQTRAEHSVVSPGIRRTDKRIAFDGGTLAAQFGAAYEQMTGNLIGILAKTPLLLIAALIVLLASWLGGMISRRLNWLKLRSQNPYMEGLARTVTYTAIVLVGVLVALDLLGWTSLVGAVLGSAGVVGLALGFAFKDIAENYIAGILLSLRRPFEPGDHVAIEGREGKVMALTSRATILMTMDGSQLQLPNSLVFKSVLLNYTRNPNRRFDFTTPISASASWHDALDIGTRTLAGIRGVLEDPAPSAQIKDLSGDGATLLFMAWVDQRENDLGRTRSEAMRLVRRALRAASITPPDTMQRVVLARTPETRTAEAAESAAQRDTSVDRAVDTQLAAARDTQAERDLLGEKPKPAEG